MRWFPYLPPVVLGIGMTLDGGFGFGAALLAAVLLGGFELGRRYRDE